MARNRNPSQTAYPVDARNAAEGDAPRRAGSSALPDCESIADRTGEGTAAVPCGPSSFGDCLELTKAELRLRTLSYQVEAADFPGDEPHTMYAKVRFLGRKPSTKFASLLGLIETHQRSLAIVTLLIVVITGVWLLTPSTAVADTAQAAYQLPFKTRVEEGRVLVCEDCGEVKQGDRVLAIFNAPVHIEDWNERPRKLAVFSDSAEIKIERDGRIARLRIRAQFAVDGPELREKPGRATREDVISRVRAGLHNMDPDELRRVRKTFIRQGLATFEETPKEQE